MCGPKSPHCTCYFVTRSVTPSWKGAIRAHSIHFQILARRVTESRQPTLPLVSHQPTTNSSAPLPTSVGGSRVPTEPSRWLPPRHPLSRLGDALSALLYFSLTCSTSAVGSAFLLDMSLEPSDMLSLALPKYDDLAEGRRRLAAVKVVIVRRKSC